MALISTQNLQMAYGSHVLLEDATLHAERGERIGLLGRDGAGRATLWKILPGAISPEAWSGV